MAIGQSETFRALTLPVHAFTVATAVIGASLLTTVRPGPAGAALTQPTKAEPVFTAILLARLV